MTFTTADSELGEEWSGEFSDFGRVAQAWPRWLKTAHTAEEVRLALVAASERGVPVRVQGAGHSNGGLSLCEGGVQIVNKITSDVRWLADDEVETHSGTTWSAVEEAVNQRGRSIPVATDPMEFSVGGTLSVGGYGRDSITRGAQIDHVSAFELVAPNGQTYWCSEDSNADIFRFGLAGLGMLGVITRARLRTVPAPDELVLWRNEYPSLELLAHSLAWTAEPDAAVPMLYRSQVQRVWGPQAIADYYTVDAKPPTGCEAVQPQTVEGSRWADHKLARAWVDSYGECRRLWVDYGFGYEGFVEFCSYVQQCVDDDVFGGSLASIYPSIVARGTGGPGHFPLDIRHGGEGRTYSCGLYCMVPDGDEDGLAAARRGLAGCLDKVQEIGGRPYGYGFYEGDNAPRPENMLSSADLTTFRELSKVLDPAGVLYKGIGAIPGLS